MTITGTASDDHLVGTSGDDDFDVSQGGEDRVEGGDGNDDVEFQTAYTSADRVDGGAGINDIINLHGAYAGTIVFKHVTNVETIQFGLGSFSVRVLDSVVAAGATIGIAAASLGSAQAFIFDGSGETDGRFTFFLGAGNDVVKGGAGNDGFSIGNGGDDTCYGGLGNDTFFAGFQFSALDHIDGGAGNDLLQLNGGYSGLVFGRHTAKSIETLQLAGDNFYDVTTNDKMVDAGATLTVNASSVHHPHEVVFDGSAEKDGRFAITGGTGNDHLIGGSGDDTFTGGAGIDIFNGNGGSDRFVFGSASESTSKEFDTIKEFIADDDFIDAPIIVTRIDAAVTTGKLSTAHFDANLQHAIHAGDMHASHAVLFTPDAGSLAGRTFLIIDCNNTGGYQVNQDLVIRLDDADLSGFALGNII